MFSNINQVRYRHLDVIEHNLSMIAIIKVVERNVGVKVITETRVKQQEYCKWYRITHLQSGLKDLPGESEKIPTV